MAQRQLYAGTQLLLQTACPRFGIDVTFVDATEPGAFAAAVEPGRTVLVLAETPANPRLDLVDLDDLGAIAGPMTVVDSTFATPLGQRPLDHGVDLVVHSATKGIAGHNDASLGRGGRLAASWSSWLWGFAVLQGACASPFDAMNGLRGLRTLGVRLERQQRHRPGRGRGPRGRPEATEVRYPGLASHPQHELARRQMTLPGGLLTFDLAGGLEAGVRFVEAVEVAQLATSLGGPETLVTHPASTTHVNLTPDELAANGIGPGTIRMSVGPGARRRRAGRPAPRPRRGRRLSPVRAGCAPPRPSAPGWRGTTTLQEVGRPADDPAGRARSGASMSNELVWGRARRDVSDVWGEALRARSVLCRLRHAEHGGQAAPPVRPGGRAGAAVPRAPAGPTRRGAVRALRAPHAARRTSTARGAGWTWRPPWWRRRGSPTEGVWSTVGPDGVQPFRPLTSLSAPLRATLHVTALLALVALALLAGRFVTLEGSDVAGIEGPTLARWSDAVLWLLAGLIALSWALAVLWTRRAARNLPTLSVRDARFPTWLGTWCWFVPLANLVLPYLVVEDLWRSSGEDGPPITLRRRFERPPFAVHLWWPCVVLGALLLAVAWLSMPSSTGVDVDTWRVVLVLGAIGALVLSVGAMALPIVVEEVRARQARRADVLGPPSWLVAHTPDGTEEDGDADTVVVERIELRRQETGPTWGKY